MTTDITKALAALRELHHDPEVTYSAYWFNEYQSRTSDLLAAIDAQQLQTHVGYLVDDMHFYYPDFPQEEWAKHRSVVPVYAAPPAPAVRSVREDLQRMCVEMGVYWRAPDAHGVKLTPAQAEEVLRHALLVEVEVEQAPSDAVVPPKRDWTMLQSGDTSIPVWVVHYANAIGAYMKGQNVQHWAIGPVQSRNEAPPAPAVPEGYALVPVEPTREMLREGAFIGSEQPVGEYEAGQVWAAMLAAAQAKGVGRE